MSRSIHDNYKYKSFSIGIYANDFCFVRNYFLLWEGVVEKGAKSGRKLTSQDPHGADIQNSDGKQ